MKNGIIVQQRGGDFRLIDIPLNSKEMQLALDKSNVDASWSLMCDSINYRMGIDIIGNFLTEINVTSPTGIKQINKLYNVKLEQVFWDKLEAKYKIV